MTRSLLERVGIAADRRPGAGDRRWGLLGGLGLVVVAVAGWWPSLSLWFPAADTLALVETARFGGLEGFRELWTSRLMAGTTFPADYYRPVAGLSYALDYRLWGRNPAGYQVTNLVLHVLVALLVARVALTAGRAHQDRSGAARDGRAWIGAGAAALLLLFHPLAAEVVPAPARRQDLLATLFLVGTVVLAGRFFGRPDAPDGKLLLAAWASWLLALGSKEIAVVGVPVLAVVVWWAHAHRDWSRRRREFAVAAGGFAGIFLLYLCARTAVLGGTGGEGPLSLAPGSSVGAASGYVASWLHPTGFLIGGLSDGIALSAGVVLVGVGGWLWVRFARSGEGGRGPGVRVLALGLLTAGLIMAAGPWLRARLLEAHRAGAGQGGAPAIAAGGHLTVFDLRWGLAVAVPAALGLVGGLGVIGWRRLSVGGAWKAAAAVGLAAPAAVYAVAGSFSPWSGYLALVPLAVLFGCVVVPRPGAGGLASGGAIVRLAGGLAALALLSVSPALHGLEATRTTSRIAERGLGEIERVAGASGSQGITVVGFPDVHPAYLGRATVSQVTRPPTDYTVRAHLGLFGREGAPVPSVELRDPVAVDDPAGLEPSAITARSPEPGTVVLCWPGVNEHLAEGRRCPEPAGAEP